MLTLRLDQSAESDGGHRIEISLSGPGLVPQRASVRTGFTMSPADHERVRWYLEDFLEYPVPPAPELAQEVEAQLVALGEELFGGVFGAGDGMRLWARLQGQLSSTRVEVATEVGDATALSWELMRDPATGTPVSLEAASFVRINHGTSRPVDQTTVQTPDSGDNDGRLRVLLVICRPAGHADVPFRSVSSRLVRIGDDGGQMLDLHVLRPPTFARLAQVLDAARRAGRPYHVVHFDGHGTYLDPDAPAAGAPAGGDGSPYRFAGRNFVSPPRRGRHGYLLFEDPAVEANEQLVDGPTLGDLLARAGVGVLVLNACRSAYAEAPPAPARAEDAPAEVHARVRGYGSLALEVTDAGVPGVVAMRYSVYVVTAAQFVADLYAALLAGQSLGDAVTAGRRQLAAQPNRAIAFDPLPLQDWTVPIVYESVPMALFAAGGVAGDLHLDDDDRDLAEVPRAPDVGFFGRDETLLALDRAFDRHRITLLHAFAGAGKTTTAAEFARWYIATGGLIGGLVLFSSLEQYTPLPTLLNQLADAAAPVLEEQNIAWQALDDRQRRRTALRLLKLIPVLWIWDNVEPVAGFPAPTDSSWTSAEQQELADFLRDAARTRAKVLLTSRRDEHGWLGDLPCRIELPPMPMRERIQLTQALAERHNHRISDVADWRPLLRYTAGNPLTITVLVGQALRQGYTGRDDIERFVDRLRAGESDLDDDQAHGRSRSLGASLSYGFATAFTAAERAQLAVLYLFQETVDVDALVNMGHPDHPYVVPELAGLTRDGGIALLDRAADIGLLSALGDGYYHIHPALPWYFRRERTAAAGGESAARLEAAYTNTVASLANHYFEEYESGRHFVIGPLSIEEPNLLRARRLARRAGRWDDVFGCMQGLRSLYQHLGRSREWSRLVEELTPDVTDPATGDARPDRLAHWLIHADYRIRIARDARDWSTASALQRVKITHDQARAAEALATPSDQLTEGQRRRIHTLSVSEQRLGGILRDQGDPRCVTHFERAAELARRIGGRREEGILAFNLGRAYQQVPGLQDLDQAEYWYRRSLELADPDDPSRPRTRAQLGAVALRRFFAAQADGQPEQVQLNHLNTAAAAYRQALRDLPPEAVTDLAVIHNELGTIHVLGGRSGDALHHYQQSIRYEEQAGNRYGAGQTRNNLAILLFEDGRIKDALLYAHAALRDFESYGGSAAGDVDKVKRLIARIDPAGTPEPSA